MYRMPSSCLSIISSHLPAPAWASKDKPAQRERERRPSPIQPLTRNRPVLLRAVPEEGKVLLGHVPAALAKVRGALGPEAGQVPPGVLTGAADRRHGGHGSRLAQAGRKGLEDAPEGACGIPRVGRQASQLPTSSHKPHTAPGRV